jgi:hypothetical protein
MTEANQRLAASFHREPQVSPRITGYYRWFILFLDKAEMNKIDS